MGRQTRSEKRSEMEMERVSLFLSLSLSFSFPFHAANESPSFWWPNPRSNMAAKCKRELK